MKQVRLACFAFLLVVVAGHSSAVNPGVRVAVSRAGIDYGAQKAVDVLSRQLSGKTFDPLSGEGDHIKYELSNLRLKSFSPPQSSVTTSPFSWSLTDVSASLSADYHYTYSHIIKFSDSGSLDASLEANLRVTIAMGVDVTGRPTIKSSGSQCDVHDLHISVHGSVKKLIYGALIGLFKGKIEDALGKALCNEIETVINVNAAQELATMKVVAPISDQISINYQFVQAPHFRTNSIEADLKGEFLWTGDHQQCPLRPKPIPSAPEVKMLSFWLTEYTVNTLGYISFKHDALHYHLTRDDLPQEYRGLLNTTCSSIFSPCIGLVVPQLAKAYPNHTVSVNMNVTQAPTIKVNPSGIYGTWVGQINFLTNNQTRRDVSLFTCDVSIGFNVSVAMKGHNVTAHIAQFQISQFSVKASSVGKIDAEKLKTLFNFVIQGFVVLRLNELGATGFQLPSVSGVTFVKPELKMLNGSLFVGVDLKYDG